MYSYGPPLVTAQKEDDQLEHTYSSYTGCSPEDLPEAMKDREKWREWVRDIHASGSTWWWLLAITFSTHTHTFRWRYIYDNVITMIRKSSKHSHATSATLYSCFDLIWSHQQCILWSPPLEIEPATTECKAETLSLGHRSMLHISDPK